MSERVYATKFHSPLEATHRIMNVENYEVVFKGTQSECLAFLSGLEHADNTSDSLWYICVMEEIPAIQKASSL